MDISRNEKIQKIDFFVILSKIIVFFSRDSWGFLRGPVDGERITSKAGRTLDLEIYHQLSL